MSNNVEVSTNQILAALPQSEYSRLAPYLKPVFLNIGSILHNSGQSISQVYFPEQAIISLVSIMMDGSTTEISLVGNEGMIGVPVVLGDLCANYCSMVQVSGTAIALSTDILKRELRDSEHLRQLLLLYTQAQLIYVSQTAACNRQHLIEERLIRWLLSVQDCLQSNELPVTQEVIANMLGVRRTTVSEAASILQQKGLIQYRRGRIKILDRDRLESSACECYSIIRNEYARLLGCKSGCNY